MKGARTDIVKSTDLEALSQAAANFCLQCASAAIADRGAFTIAFAGGSTPRRAYELLASAPRCEHTDWSKWHAFWGDERLVPLDDPNSNYRLADDGLLKRVPIPPYQVHRVHTETEDAALAAAAYEATLRSFFELRDGEMPRFDLVLLGLGSDGHVASLFPGNPSLDQIELIVTSSRPGTLPPPVDRITLTLPAINNARAVAIVVSGAEKSRALRKVVRDRDDALPATRIQPLDGELRWFVDEAASAEL